MDEIKELVRELGRVWLRLAVKLAEQEIQEVNDATQSSNEQ